MIYKEAGTISSLIREFFLSLKDRRVTDEVWSIFCEARCAQHTRVLIYVVEQVIIRISHMYSLILKVSLITSINE